MKTGITTLLLLISCFASAQLSNLTIFNNGGQAFFVILNGIKQNSIPKTNLQITGLQASSYELKLIFADGVTPDLGKSLWLEPGFEYTMRVKKTKKNKLKIQGFDQVAISATPAPVQEQVATVCYRPTNTASFGDQIQTLPAPPNGGSSAGGGQVNVHQNENIQQVVYDEFGNPINVTVNISGQTTTISSSSTGTTGTTNGQQNSQGSNGSNGSNGNGGAVTTNDHSHDHGTHVHPDGTVHSNSDHATETAEAATPSLDLTTRLTCVNPSTSIDAIIKELKLASFTADQYAILKNKLWNKCVSAAQAEEIVKTFTYETDKLVVAKYCVNRMSDPMNAPALIDLFNFSSSKSDFMKFLSSHR
jgi:hypothetical protein